jgi:hypothetical protein
MRGAAAPSGAKASACGASTWPGRSPFAGGAGIAIGTWFQRRQPPSVAATIAAVEAFALAGGLAVIFFEPPWLQRIAVCGPLTYGMLPGEPLCRSRRPAAAAPCRLCRCAAASCREPATRTRWPD